MAGCAACVGFLLLMLLLLAGVWKNGEESGERSLVIDCISIIGY